MSFVGAYLDLIDRAEGIISTFRYADWDGARKRHGALGVVCEFIASCFKWNAPQLTCSDEVWNGNKIEQKLDEYGVKIWDRGMTANGKDVTFRVKARQRVWAEQLMAYGHVGMRQKVQDNNIFANAAKHVHNYMPKKWSDKRRAR